MARRKGKPGPEFRLSGRISPKGNNKRLRSGKTWRGEEEELDLKRCEDRSRLGGKKESGNREVPGDRTASQDREWSEDIYGGKESSGDKKRSGNEGRVLRT